MVKVDELVLALNHSALPAAEFENILTVIKTINRSLILEDVMKLVLDNAIHIAHAERGFLILGTDILSLHSVLARDVHGTTLDDVNHKISDSIVRDVFQTGESVCVEHAQHDEQYDQRSSILNLSLETILCSPLIVRDETIGVIYVDSRHIQPVNRDEILNLFEILAGQAAISIKNAQLYDRVNTAFEELQKANDVMVKLDRMAIKGEMAAEISHELKNLFNIALLQLDSLERSFANNSPEMALQRIRETNESVKKISIFAQNLVETSSLQTTKSIGNFNKTIAGIVQLVKALSKYKEASFTLTFDDNLPLMKFDQQQISQLLLNLLNNAVEALPESSIQLTTVYQHEKGRIRLTIVDNGPGIREDLVMKMFQEKFSTKSDGHGYGLPICRKIVENHGGVINVSSCLGGGTTFTIDIPVNGI
ncbi:MAG: GAF domain-containing sensor histidine kinase [Ignavibacteriales bacterium]|nr:GAF domain-containing sensor histidine kinase [Ignavibacteriales bacterium]